MSFQNTLWRKTRLYAFFYAALAAIIACNSGPPNLPTNTNTPLPIKPLVPTATSMAGTQVPTPPVDLNAVAAQIAENLPEGKALFNPPEEMKVGENKRVVVRILQTSSDDGSDVEVTIVAGLEGEVEPQIFNVTVGTIMKANLAGPAFEIVSLTEEEQIVTPNRVTEWAWDISPTKSGDQQLTLNLSVLVRAEGIGEKTFATSESRTVSVKINPRLAIASFIAEYWQWLATAIVVPVGTWAWKKYSDSRKKPGVKSKRSG